MKIENCKLKIGFTFIELLVGISILVILMIVSVSVFVFFREKSVLSNNTEEVINVFKSAQSKTLASEGASQYGVYFDTTTSPHEYTLFKGPDFASRDILFDKVYKLSNKVEFYEINLAGSNEVVFEKLTGMTNQIGSISLRLKDKPTETKTIYIEGSGNTGLVAPISPSNSLITDSRHVHFDYSRFIDTSIETLTLSFDSGAVIESIPISEYLVDGQFYWQGEIDVNGEIQKIKIHTHRLNNTDTEFCVHRDRRYNNKSLVISISGDGSGTLIEYSSDGLITNYTSIYVSNLSWQ